jgi:phospholipase/carboxylesterase
MSLAYRHRPAAGEAEGALVLFHGRGADENDLFPVLDLLDPERRFDGYTPRGPLSFPPGGAHWYAVHRIGYPDPTTFAFGYNEAAAWLDGLGVPPERTVLGGFSQGAVMSYALGLDAARPRPAAIVGFSGFVPTVPGLELDFHDAPPVAIGHGSYDGVISVEFGRRAHELLPQALYREYPLPHAIDPGFVEEVRSWLQSVLSSAPTSRTPSS